MFNREVSGLARDGIITQRLIEETEKPVEENKL